MPLSPLPPLTVTALQDAYERVRAENAALRAREVRFMHDPLLRRRRLADTPPELVRLLVQGLQVRCSHGMVVLLLKLHSRTGVLIYFSRVFSHFVIIKLFFQCLFCPE